MAEEAIKIRPSIKVSVSGLISQRDENANEKIMHINHSMKAVCVSRGWLFIDNARIKVEHLKNKGIHLNGDGVKLLASNFIRQALKAKIKAGENKRKPEVASTNSEQDNSDLVGKLDSEGHLTYGSSPLNADLAVK